MARPPTSIQAITANRLLDGRVVFLTPAHDWDGNVDTAEIFADPQAAEGAMQIAQAAAAANEIVDPYAIAVTTTAGHVTPTILRERIRAEGPTIPSDFTNA